MGAANLVQQAPPASFCHVRIPWSTGLAPIGRLATAIRTPFSIQMLT
jgi:hypothetical protein